MKKVKDKPKTALKEAGSLGTRGQVVKLKPKPKPKRSWSLKLPPVLQYWSTVRQFVAEAWLELSKVTWPNRKETLGTTGVVLVLVILIAVYLGLVDFGLSHLVRYVVH
jgi:preprotein translocase subunit SecE